MQSYHFRRFIWLVVINSGQAFVVMLFGAQIHCLVFERLFFGSDRLKSMVRSCVPFAFQFLAVASNKFNALFAFSCDLKEKTDTIANNPSKELYICSSYHIDCVASLVDILR